MNITSTSLTVPAKDSTALPSPTPSQSHHHRKNHRGGIKERARRQHKAAGPLTPTTPSSMSASLSSTPKTKKSHRAGVKYRERQAKKALYRMTPQGMEPVDGDEEDDFAYMSEGESYGEGEGEDHDAPSLTYDSDEHEEEHEHEVPDVLDVLPRDGVEEAFYTTDRVLTPTLEEDETKVDLREEDSTVYEEKTKVEPEIESKIAEIVLKESPAVAPEPVVLEIPAAVPVPIESEEPAIVEELPVVEEMIVVEDPVIEEPVVVEQPAAIEEPVTEDKAAIEEAIRPEVPTAIEAPFIPKELPILEEKAVPVVVPKTSTTPSKKHTVQLLGLMRPKVL